MRVSNFGGTFDELFLWLFYEIFTEDASLLLLYQGTRCKKVEIDQKLKSKGSCLTCVKGVRMSTGWQEPTVAGTRKMEVLGEKVNAHLP